MIKIRYLAAAAGAAAVLAATAAGPALAAGPSGGGDVQVGSVVSSVAALTLTGLNSSINLNGRQGTTIALVNAETYTVQSNDNYTLTLTPGARLSSTTSADFIPNSALTVTETGAGTSPASIGTTAITIDTESNVPVSGATFNYAENWSLAIPASQVPATYQETFSYLALGA
jgi:hypothetical protein